MISDNSRITPTKLTIIPEITPGLAKGIIIRRNLLPQLAPVSSAASSNSLPTKGLAFISLKDSHKEEGVDLAKQLLKLNFTLCATRGTADYIRKYGIKIYRS